MQRALCGLVVCAALVALVGGSGQALAGPVGGRVVKTALVAANTTDVYTVRLAGGARTTVIVIGDGDTDLDLFVYDRFGNLVAQDTDIDDDCAVVFVPPAAGNYTIKVKNLGNVGNRYRMVVK
jgi:hypothetical protein